MGEAYLVLGGGGLPSLRGGGGGAYLVLGGGGLT